MAKKTYHRKENISTRREREEKEKQKNKKHLTKQQKIVIGVCAGVVVLAVLLFLLLFPPNGAISNYFGGIIRRSPDGIVAGLEDHRYYNIGTWIAPEGYTLDEEQNIKKDENDFEGWYNNDNTEAAIKYFYAGVVPNKTSSEMLETLSQYYTEMSEIQAYDTGKFTYHYITCLSAADSESATFSRLIVGYADTKAGNNEQNCAFLFNFSSAPGATDTLPTFDAMWAEATPLLDSFTPAKEAAK